jgi:hypothetical protein
MEISQELNEMNNLYKEANKKNEIFDSRFLYRDNKSIANTIRNSSNELMSNTNLLKSVHEEIMSSVQMLKDVFTYEFLFYEPTIKILNASELLSMAQSELSRYQGIVGGYKIEDQEWIKCEQNSRFKLNPSQIGIYNTMTRDNSYSENQVWFIKAFARHMRKFISYDDNFLSFYHKIYDDESNDISWILFICEDKSIYYNDIDNQHSYNTSESDEFDEGECMDPDDNELEEIIEMHDFDADNNIADVDGDNMANIDDNLENV